MWDNALSLFLHRLVKYGNLIVVFPHGQSAQFGDHSSASITVRLHERSLSRKILLNPDLALGEGYVDGALTVDNDDLYGLVELLVVNLAHQPDVAHYPWLAWARRLCRGLAQFNPVARSRQNVVHHYDLSSDLYAQFLDSAWQYSCGYFSNPDDELENAQENKKALIARKLLLQPGQTVLDIGCGWGGLGLHIARDHDVDVTGITLSQEQHKAAEKRTKTAGLTDHVQFQLQDYRHVSGTFDRIVSVGMFEHVGVPHYQEFFATLRDRLSDDGIALLHTIGRTDGPAATNPWIAKYIFPGGYSPALSEILAAIEPSGLYVTDIEVWRLHYAETLKAWRQRFEANMDRVRDIYDARFCRMWRFYLILSELAFRHGGHVVFQIQLAKRQDAVPLTRDYLTSTEVTNVQQARVA